MRMQMIIFSHCVLSMVEKEAMQEVKNIEYYLISLSLEQHFIWNGSIGQQIRLLH